MTASQAIAETSEPGPGLVQLYSEHWQHLRHVANERLAFASFYLISVGSSLAFIYQASGVTDSQKTTIFATLLLFSVLGFHAMVRSLATFWYHYLELKRLTPLVCPGEALDYEGRQREVEAAIKASEPQLWFLNRFFLAISSKGGLLLPLTLLYPTIFFVGFVVFAVLLALQVFLSP